MPLLLTLATSFSGAAEAWHFLPNYTHDIRGIEARPPGGTPFHSSVPEKVRRLADGDALPEAQKKQLYWRPAAFPHRDFVNLMPMRKVFGWYGCEFDVPRQFAGMDVLADLGLIDDSDETFVNGQPVGKSGKVPDGYAWQADRLYRIPAKGLAPNSNYIAVHVWSLWGLGGIVGPPVLKAALAPADAQWDIAFIDDTEAPKGGLNAAATLESATGLLPSNEKLKWRKASMPWNGFAQWKDGTHYAVFRLEFDLTDGDGPPRSFPEEVVIDMGAVFDAAAFYLNGRRVGTVGRFPEGAEPAFTEAAQRARFIARPGDWSKDGHNTLAAIVYRERGVGGLPNAPGIVLRGLPDAQGSFAEQADLLRTLVQSRRMREAEALLGQMKPSSDTERAWLLSHRAHLAFLEWLDGGGKDKACLDGVLAPVAEILSKLPDESPRQSAMQAFCRVLRMAGDEPATMSIVKKLFPSFSEGCIALPPDRMTKGDWMMYYGKYYHALAAMGQTADWTGGIGQCKYRLYVPGKKDVPRYWLPNSQRKLTNTSAFVMHIPFVEESGRINAMGIKDVSPFLFPKLPIRRASWWDDHGEMHPFDDEGPDMTMQISSLPDECLLSIYYLDYDWKNTLHPRQQSMMVFDDSGNFVDALWLGKTDNGVYGRLLLSNRQSMTLRFPKHRGACVAVSGFFVDRPPVLPIIPEKLHGEVREDIVKLYDSIRHAKGAERTRLARCILNEQGKSAKREPTAKELFILAAALECEGPGSASLNIILDNLQHVGKPSEILDWLEAMKDIGNASPAWHYAAAACLLESLPSVSGEDADEYIYRLFTLCDNRFLLPIRRICLNALKKSPRAAAAEKIKQMGYVLPERYNEQQ